MMGTIPRQSRAVGIPGYVKDMIAEKLKNRPTMSSDELHAELVKTFGDRFLWMGKSIESAVYFERVKIDVKELVKRADPIRGDAPMSYEDIIDWVVDHYPDSSPRDVLVYALVQLRLRRINNTPSSVKKALWEARRARRTNA